MIKLILVLLFSFAATAYSANNQAKNKAKPKTLPASGFVRPTVYYIPTYDIDKLNCRSVDQVTIRTKDGKAIARACNDHQVDCAMQGSCYLRNKDHFILINVTSVAKGKLGFQVLDKKVCPFGLGNKGACSDPFYSIAADPKLYKMGTVIFINSIRGLKLPNGEIHSGYFIVRDTGGAIKGSSRFDFFTGIYGDKDNENIFDKMGLSDKNKRFEYRIAPPGITKAVHASRGYPGLIPSVHHEALELFGP